MVDFVKSINNSNYITAVPVKSNKKQMLNTTNGNSCLSCPIYFTSSQPSICIRTEFVSKEEKQKYTALLNSVDKSTRKQLELLLKSGILLNSNSNDNSTVLDNLHKMATTPRAKGLDRQGILRDTIATITYPYLITQQFGDIPQKYREMAKNANMSNGVNVSGSGGSGKVSFSGSNEDIDVEHSGTCVAASIEFNLAEKMPAEFVRFAEGLSSPSVSVKKDIKFNNLADNIVDAVWLLNEFKIPYEADNFNGATLTFAPDNKAIIRATIQTTDRDPYERSPLDVLMQSTFMQVGSQQTYNSLTDKRHGKFNQNDKGLIEFEKTFTESVVEDKNKMSVTYQTVDENARLVGYEMSFDDMKQQLLTTLDMGENIIIGYTLINQNNVIINGHEITIIGYKKDDNGKLIFICNDTDDDISKPVEYTEDYLLPKIHHAALPQSVLVNEVPPEPTWRDGLNDYKQMRAA